LVPGCQSKFCEISACQVWLDLSKVRDAPDPFFR
jgi:hypothetical protein